MAQEQGQPAIAVVLQSLGAVADGEPLFRVVIEQVISFAIHRE